MSACGVLIVHCRSAGGHRMRTVTQLKLILSVLVLLLLGIATLLPAQTFVTTTTASLARDPGVRGGAAGAGGPITGLTARQLEFFAVSKVEFETVEDVAEGLGPRMNLDSCAGCHAQPA